MPNPSNSSAAGGAPPPPIAPPTPLQTQTIDQIYAEAAALKSIITTTPDIGIYRAANDEYAACQDRISALLNLKLAADTAEMQAAVPAIQQAKAALDTVLQTLSKASDLITGVAKFLGAVDSLITAAKIAASLV